MKTVSISGSPRENVGTKDAKEKRRQGLIPCVIYGGKKQHHFYTNELNFRDLIYTPNSSLVKLELNGETFDCMLQDAQFHPVTDKILHADFLEIFDDKPIKIDVPVRIEGKAPGVTEGGILHLLKREVIIKALPKDLPDFITIDISNLDIGDSIQISSLDYDNLEFLEPQNSVVVMVKSSRASSIGMELGEDVETEGEEGEEGEVKEGEEGTEGEAKDASKGDAGKDEGSD